MYFSRLRKFSYAGALLAVVPFVAMAQAPAEPISAPPKVMAAPAAPAVVSTPGTSCGPTTMKVKVCEMVPTQVQATRTVYKSVTTQEAYTAYKYETVSEVVQKQVTEYQKITEMVNETRTRVCKIPVIEERTEMVTKWTWQTVTEMVNKTVRGGHWECTEVPTGPGLLQRLCNKGSCDPCNPCGNSCAPTCATKTKKCWVSDCHTECVPVCKKKLVKECVPVCKKVCTYRCETKCEVVPVCKTRCVPVCKTVNCTVCKKICVPYQATRCVTKCVPVCENYTVCKMVPTWVEKEVACAPACAPACSSPCGASTSCCATTTCCKAGLFSGLKGRFASKGGCCPTTSCGAPSCCN